MTDPITHAVLTSLDAYDRNEIQHHHPLCSAVHPARCADCGGTHCDCATIGRLIEAVTHDIITTGDLLMVDTADEAATENALNHVLTTLHPHEPTRGLYRRLGGGSPHPPYNQST